MSSLRLALKQSLQETVHLAPQSKKQRRRNKSNNNATGKPKAAAARRKPRQPGDPPRKRGRPRKHPRPEDLAAMAAAAAGSSESQQQPDSSSQHQEQQSQTTPSTSSQPAASSARVPEEEESSENEFSYDSEEEETDDEEEETEDEDEEEEEEEEEEDEEEVGDEGEEEEEHEEEDDEEVDEEAEAIVRSWIHNNEEYRRAEREAAAPPDNPTESATDDYEERKKLKVKQDPSESDEERRRKRKLFKKQLNAAANKIQSHWKKAKAKSSPTSSNGDTEGAGATQPEDESSHTATVPVSETTAQPTEDPETSPSRAPEQTNQAEFSQEAKSSHPEQEHEEEQQPKPKKKKKKKDSDAAPRTVPPPVAEVLEWSRNLSERKCRKNIASGMRVKVRFSAKVKRDGKVVKKKIWYGGRVSAVSKEGSKIRIKYDDGTSEISKFPDKDVVVDETSNGQHIVNADRFLPPSMRGGGQQQEEPEEEEVVEAKIETTVETVAPPSTSETPAATIAETKESSSEAKPQPAESQSSEAESKREDGATTPVKMDTEPSEPGQAAEEPKDVEMTPVTKAPQEADSAPAIPKGLLSPEEGELSPGITVSKISTIRINDKQSEEPTSMDVEATTVESEAPKAAVEETPLLNPLDVLAATAAVEEEKVEVAPAPESPPAKEKSPEEKKASLTIRIPNVKPKDPAVLQTPKPQQSTPKSPKAASDGETSEEELFADTPVTQREVKSIDLRKFDGSKKKLSKKRQASDSADSPHPKRRIHLKREREVAPADTRENVTSAVKADLEEPGEVVQELEVVEVPKLAPAIPADPASPKEPRINISLRKQGSETELEIPLAPSATKPKRKKDRANSPNPRKSPVNQRRMTPTGEIDQESASPVVVKPISKQMKRSASGEVGPESGAETSPMTKKGVVGSKNSAFARKVPTPKESTDDATDSQATSQVEADGELVDTPVSKPAKSREGSRASSEASVPTGRSGRRAAQQAKEKLNSKSDPEAPGTGRRKKKRKRKDGGESGGEESDHSEDDPQWVQCDSCSKWRILPSSVKASSLPKHWYCHLNVYDPKRNSCAAPEQTLKQVAKERRKAKKRARQQRLEQAAQLESAQQEEVAAKEKGTTTPVNSPKSTKVVISAKKLASISSAEAKRAAAATPEEPQQQSDSGSDTAQKTEKEKPEKKTRKGRKPEQEKDDSHHSAAEIPPEQPPKVKVGRKRGRPARNPDAAKQEKKDDDNVQWVMCEKCEKWRKLPAHIEPDELPDTWYCSMNTWNPDLSCESPEDKADASHLEVGKGQGQVPLGNPGKNSYRSLIFGTGRKHNRPMSERSRAAESLFMRPIDEEENPHPTVMYSKSSVFLPRTSNFTKSSAVEEKRVSIFEVLSNSDLWTELSGIGQQPQPVLSSSKPGQGFPKFVTFENLPEEARLGVREAVLHALGSGAHRADDLLAFMKSHSWDSEMAELVPAFNTDTIINALLALVRDGIVEMACFRDPTVPLKEWVPKYRRVRSKRALASEEAMKASKCMKIRKPWKQREEATSEWISGGAAFS